MRIGAFGGTFDPPHIAHLVLAAECCAQLRLDQLLWVLTPKSPFKQGRKISPAAQRLALVRAAIKDEPRFAISRVDLDRPAPQYAVDTVKLLKEAHPGAELFYLIGGDSLRDLPQWSLPDELLAAVDGLGVMRRPGDAADLPALESLLPGLSAKVQFVDAPLLDISGTEIRARIADGRPYRYFLPDAVFKLIVRRGYYSKA